MKSVIVASLLVVASVASAAEKQTFPINDVLTFEVKAMGNVRFFHKAHALSLGCRTCHDANLSTNVTGKDAAHKFCKGCHIARNQGPMRCPSCHKKP